MPYPWQRKGINKLMTTLIKHKCWQKNKHIVKLDEYIAPPKINTFYNKTIMDACYGGTITDYSDY